MLKRLFILRSDCRDVKHKLTSVSVSVLFFYLHKSLREKLLRMFFRNQEIQKTKNKLSLLNNALILTEK